MNTLSHSAHNKESNDSKIQSFRQPRFPENPPEYWPKPFVQKQFQHIFLTISLRLFPSLPGFSLILLHTLTIATAVSGCSVFASTTTATTSDRLYGTHMVATVLTAIFQGAVSVLIFTRTEDFLRTLKSYVRDDDGAVILKLAGGLCVLMFCLEWIVLVLAFLLKYSDYLDEIVVDDHGEIRRQEEDLKDWPSYPFQLKL